VTNEAEERPDVHDAAANRREWPGRDSRVSFTAFLGVPFGMAWIRTSLLVILGGMVAFLLLVAPAGRLSAQWEGPPADLAEQLWRRGYVFHVLGAYPQAIKLFRQSIEERPTAEGHTFLGWSLGHIGRIGDAIAECRKAIEIDPDFGNPYNDIGVYLVWLGRPDEAIPWLRKAISAKRYCCYQFPHFSLGQILLNKGRVLEARRLFEKALKFDPDYAPAKEALKEIGKSWL
jgi:tetratricopeptide (TPR) repeat protein